MAVKSLTTPAAPSVGGSAPTAGATLLAKWTPQRPRTPDGAPRGRWPQWHFVRCPADEILYGGARGGGKSVGLLLRFLARVKRYPDEIQGIIFRRSFTPELEELIRLSHKMFTPLGAKWNGKGYWSFGKSQLRFRHLDRDSEAQSYQGHSYTDLMFDELTTWPSYTPIQTLAATLRSGEGVPSRQYATANPGGPGHHHVKARYIDPCPRGWQGVALPVDPDNPLEGSLTGCYIPATLDDNPKLQDADPRYWLRVKAATAGNKELEKAWRYGIWDIVAGGFFDDLWSMQTHVIEPFSIPHSWRVDRSFDWGESRPFSVGWWAESDGTDARMKDGTSRSFPRGSLFRIGEWYGCRRDPSGNIKPNEGLRMPVREVAHGIVKREERGVAPGVERSRIKAGPADSSIFDTRQGETEATSMAQMFQKYGVKWERSNKSPGSRHTGWSLLRQLLKATVDGDPDEPRLYVFPDCTEFIRTVPVLPRAARDPDDIDTEAEDHVADEVRYRILHRHKTGRVRLTTATYG